MARANIGDLLGAVTEANNEPPRADLSKPARNNTAKPSAVRPRAAAALTSASAASGDEVTSTKPHYLEFVRKEARFTDEQLEQLNTITRQLNKARQGSGERITDNTLIRVAVDLLLAKQGRISGSSEGAIRKSVGLSVTNRLP